MSKIFKVAVVAVLIAVFLQAFAAANTSTADTYTVQNESVTVNYNSPSHVDNADVAQAFYGNETITNSSGSELVEDIDYQWNDANGTITWYDTNATASGEVAEIDYAYRGHDETTRALANIFQVSWVPMQFAVLALGILAVLGLILAGNGGGGGR